MFIYIILGIVLLLFWLFNLPFLTVKRGEIVYIKCINWLFIFCIFIFLFFLSYMRGINVGTDYYLYFNFFNKLMYKEYFDLGIRFIYDIANYFNDFRIITIIATLVFLLIFYYLQNKYSYSVVNFIYMFVISFLFFFFLNGLRQAIAIAILWIGLLSLSENKNKKRELFLFFLIVVIAAQFHISAVMGFFFLVVKKFKINGRTLFIGLLVVTFSFFTDILKDFIGSLLMNIDFYTEKYSYDTDFFFRVNKEKGIIQFIPILMQFGFFFVWLKWKKLKGIKGNYIIENYYYLYLFFYAASGIEAIDRFQLYLYPSIVFFYDMVLFLIIKSCNTKKELLVAWGTSTIIIFFWLAYYLLRIFQNTNGIVPYSFWFE
ncbi:hypothetical protein CON84_01745 [Bacillus sp. AFS094228]|nr:hypothetical protein CON84_01745 [Bacillus sp. AFS094228]